MKNELILFILAILGNHCMADVTVVAPTPAGPVGNPYDTSTDRPFLIKQFPLSSMRYQQVYNASAFTNVPPEFIYITTLRFIMDRIGNPWTVTNMQINLSTTSKSADGLSPVFAENVGTDDTIVFGPGRHDFGFVTAVLILLDGPFRYNPAQGNLLLDVRVFNGRGSRDTQFFPSMDAQNSPTDEGSSAWADDVTATVATGVDTIGLLSGIQFSPVPSLRIQVESVFGTNRPVLRWPSQPSVFVPQTSSRLGTNAVWQTVTNNILGSPEDPDRVVYLPVTPPGLAGFYRLIWPSGQLLRPAGVLAAPAETEGPAHLK